MSEPFHSPLLSMIETLRKEYQDHNQRLTQTLESFLNRVTNDQTIIHQSNTEEASRTPAPSGCKEYSKHSRQQSDRHLISAKHSKISAQQWKEPGRAISEKKENRRRREQSFQKSTEKRGPECRINRWSSRISSGNPLKSLPKKRRVQIRCCKDLPTSTNVNIEEKFGKRQIPKVSASWYWKESIE